MPQYNQYSHTHTTVSRLCGICPGQPGWAGTRRNIHPLTLIVVINHPNLLYPSTTNHGILHIQSTCSAVFFHNLSPSFLWSTSWPGTLHFILHTFLHLSRGTGRDRVRTKNLILINRSQDKQLGFNFKDWQFYYSVSQNSNCQYWQTSYKIQ